MTSMHVFWSLREGVLTFQPCFQTAGYLACLKSYPCVTRSRNFPRLIVETASDSVARGGGGGVLP